MGATLAEAVSRTAALPPDERLRELRLLEARAAGELAEVRRELARVDFDAAVDWLREGADVRAELERRGQPVDELPLATHEAIDAGLADGSLREAFGSGPEVPHIAGANFEANIRRAYHGRFGGWIGGHKEKPGRGLRGPGGDRIKLRKGRDVIGDRGHVERRGETPHHEAALHLGGTRTELVRRLLGRHRDTREKYSEGGPGGKQVYSAERRAQHRAWIEDLLSGHEAPAQDERHIVFVAGGPASGKSSAEGAMQLSTDKEIEGRKRAVEIDQDHFKAKIGEYRRLAKEKDPYASDAAHREAADVAHQARLEAMRRGLNVIVQGTGDSGPDQFSRKIVEAAGQGYHVHGFYASAPTEVALERARGRAASTGRAVPEHGLRAMHANVSRRFADVEGVLPHLDSLEVFDTREDTRKGGKARRMAHLEGDRLVEDRPDLMREFRNKAAEHPGDVIDAPHYV